MEGTVSYVREFAERSQFRVECITTVTFEENNLAMASETTMLSQYTQTPSKSWATKCSHTTSNFLKDFPTPISALIAFLEGEKKAATMRRRQCEKFIGTSKMLLLSVEDEVRSSVHSIREEANEEFSIILRLLSLIR